MDGEKLRRLPKWAQKLIQDQARRIDERDKLIADLREESTIPEWHDWEFSTHERISNSDGKGSKFPKRYINASTMRLRANGIECEFSAISNGQIRISFDLDRDMQHPGFKQRVVVLPDASNCLKLARMTECDPVHVFDDALKKS